MHSSVVEPRGVVAFPEYTGERVYMREFFQREGLPADLARWQPTVDAMLEGVDAPGPIYLMIDQAAVRAGKPHRRPGVHIDGYWMPEIQAHKHIGCRRTGGWTGADFGEAEGLLLASNVTASRAFVGVFSGEPGEGGDCRHIDLAGLRAVTLQAGRAYAGNVTMLHESVPVNEDCLRTLVRLNVPGWSPRYACR